MTSDRDELINLISKSQDYGATYEKSQMDERKTYIYETPNSVLADCILADGWIKPPCKPYEDVYLIVNRIVERCTVEGVHYTRKKNYIRLRPYHQEYLGNWSKYYTPTLSAFGKTVFSTREEAEQALEHFE